MKAGSSFRSLTCPRPGLALVCGAPPLDFQPSLEVCRATVNMLIRESVPAMLDQPASEKTPKRAPAPRLHLQEHLADLDAAGLLVRIDRPINKDTELIPLVRWQFIGGIPEDQWRPLLFPNVS